MIDQSEKLKTLTSEKLIDVVKNYRQYGYSIDVRDQAILELDDRGIDLEQLVLSGNFENQEYNYALVIYKSFRKNSNMAFLFYGLTTVMGLVRFPDAAGSLGVFLGIGAFSLFFIFLISSFLNQNQFYKATGDNFGTDGALLYLLAGMPFYVLMYFYFRNQMRERMKLIE